MSLNKVALYIGVVSILAATSISILAIWGYIDDNTLVWRTLATLGVVFLGVIMSVVVGTITKDGDDKK